MTPEELAALQLKVGADATAAIQKELAAYEAKVREFATQIVEQKGGITKEQFDAYKVTAEAAVEVVKAIAEKQGTTLATVAATLTAGGAKVKSIGEILYDDKAELKAIHENKQGVKSYMVTINEKGMPIMRPLSDTQTKVGYEATVAGVGVGNVAAITQSLDAATLLRVGNGAMINNQYRNSPWIFELCNTINAGYGSTPFVMWFDESPKLGGSTLVPEGAAKPLSQYLYTLKSDTYKKEATIIGMTEEFSLDFAQLEANIMTNGRIDVLNRVNSAILPRIISNATLYNTELSFRGGTGAGSYIPLVNDFDAIAAMAAQVDNATFGARANTAVMSTFKKYRMGITKETTGGYINPPDVLNGISFIGNPAMAADAVLVGDLKQYNIQLRGGLIVKVGYNGTDFAENKFSVVMEQYYFDWISTIRKVAIVSGPTFLNVKNTLTDDQGSL